MMKTMTMIKMIMITAMTMIVMIMILIMTMMFRLWCRASQSRPLEVINLHLTHHQGKDDDDLRNLDDDNDEDDDDDEGEKGKTSICKPGLEKKRPTRWTAS